MGFKSISEEIYTFLNAQSAFTTVMGNKIFPVVASESTVLPLTTYRIVQGRGQTKDADGYTIELAFWFSVEKYDQCMEFLDTMTEIFKNSNYKWVSSEPDFNEESYTYNGIINLEKI